VTTITINTDGVDRVLSPETGWHGTVSYFPRAGGGEVITIVGVESKFPMGSDNFDEEESVGSANSPK
jgi:hypothetical protein